MKKGEYNDNQKTYKDDHDKFMENNIDINQYIQFDEKVCDMIIYFNKNKFIADALEYLQNDNQDYQIIVEDENKNERPDNNRSIDQMVFKNFR